MKKISIFVCFMYCALHVSAQSDYRSGYVITLANDTVHGAIDYRGDATMGRVCHFESQEKVKQDFFPTDIAAYRFTDSKYFVSREVDRQRYFLEFLIKGKINVYYFRDDFFSDHYYIERENDTLMELPFIPYHKMSDDPELYKSKLVGSIGLLSYFTQDAPELKKDISKLQGLGHKNLINIAKNYHNKVCRDEQCIVFEKPMRWKVQIEPTVGFYHIRSATLTELKKDLDSYTFGVRLYLGIPYISNNLYFKTGLFGFRNIKDKIALREIPLQIEYIYPKWVVKPTLAAGITLLGVSVSPLAPSYSVGVKIAPKKNSKYVISLNYEIEVSPWKHTFLPSNQLVSYCISAGLNYTF